MSAERQQGLLRLRILSNGAQVSEALTTDASPMSEHSRKFLGETQIPGSGEKPLLLSHQRTSATVGEVPLSGANVIRLSARALASRRRSALPTCDKNDQCNVIPLPLLKSSNSGLQRSAGAAKILTKTIGGRISEGIDNYRHQMFVNGLVAAFVGMLVMTGQWMFTILASIP